MSRTQIRIEMNGRLAFAGWADEPVPIAIMAMSENNAALTATIERVKALAQRWTDDFMTRDTTHDDRDDRADARNDCAMDIRAALEVTQ